MTSAHLTSIVEPIGYTWHNELVYLDLPFDGPARVVEAATGRELPSQICGRASRLGRTEPARIAVCIDLEADQELELRVEPGPAHADAAAFSVTPDEDSFVIINDVISVCSPSSQTFAAGEAPGPVLQLRAENTREWVGQGTWGDAVGLGRIETEILDSGPLFARWIVRYIVGGLELARYDMRLPAGEDFVWVREESALDAGMAFRFALHGRDAPREWFIYGGGESVNVMRGTMDAPPDPKGQTRPGEFIHLDFHSGHNQMSYTWVGFLRGAAPAIGVTELRGGHWHIPGRNRIVVRRAKDGITFDFAANGGSREFALVCGDAARYAPAEGLSQFAHLRRTYSDLPLDKVRHWTTAWELPLRGRPLLYPPDSAAAWREKLVAWPELEQAYRNLAAQQTGDFHLNGALLPLALITEEPRFREALRGEITKVLQASVERAMTNGYLRLIIFDGRTMKVCLEAIDVLRSMGWIEPTQERAWARQLAFIAYCFVDPCFWPWDTAFRARTDPRSHGEAYWDDIGDAVCPPNFYTEYYTSFGVMGLAYPEHPAAAEWIAQSEELFERQLEVNFYESGGYIESANYHNHEIVMLCQLAVALTASGGRDFFAHPRFKANFGFFADMLTPPVAMTPSAQELCIKPTNLNPPQPGDAVPTVTAWGNSGHDCSGMLIPQTVPVAAGIYAERDPAYARRLMSAWRTGPQCFAAHYGGFNLIALGRPDLDEVALGLDSKLVEGLGAVMRAAQGTPREVFAWIKAGPATHHNCRDEGGLVLYAHGAPLIGDFGYHCEHEGRTESGYNTWKHACISYGGRTTCGYLGTEQTLPPQSWLSSPEIDLLTVYTPVELIINDHNRYLDPDRVSRIEHRRSILFVKPHYFVIYDQIPQTSLPTTYWLHALADRVDLTGYSARFRGRYGVDLDVQVALPLVPQITEGVYSVQRHIRIDQPGPGDYLTVLTPLAPETPAPGARYLADIHGLEVRGPWGTDHITLPPPDVIDAPAQTHFRVTRDGQLLG